MESVITIDKNMLIMVVGVAIIGYILLKVASKIMRAVGIVVVLALGYFFWNGGTVDDLKEATVQALFKEKDLTQLLDRYCSDDREDSFKCDCIVTPVYNDLTSRLSAEELANLSNDDEARIAEIRQSMRNKGGEIRSCIIKEKGGEYWQRVKNAAAAAGAELKKDGETDGE